MNDNVIIPSGDNMIEIGKVSQVDGAKWQKYMSPEGDFDPPMGATLDRITSSVIGSGISQAVDDVIDGSFTRAMRDTLQEIKRGIKSSVAEKVASSDLTDDEKDQLAASVSYVMQEEIDLAEIMTESMSKVRDYLKGRFAAEV